MPSMVDVVVISPDGRRVELQESVHALRPISWPVIPQGTYFIPAPILTVISIPINKMTGKGVCPKQDDSIFHLLRVPLDCLEGSKDVPRSAAGRAISAHVAFGGEEMDRFDGGSGGVRNLRKGCAGDV